jgi:RNA polymerase sigma-70 factor, ECF subfamily
MPAIPSMPNDEPSDAKLIAGAQRGEEDAFAVLARRHLPAVSAFIAMKLPVAHVAEELTHETFVFAFRNLAGFELHTSFRAWLRAIAFNLVRRELLRFAREQQNLSRLEQAQWADLARTAERSSGRDEAVFLEECLGRLPEAMQRLVQDRYHRGHSNEEIAAAWERTGEWVRVTLLRVRRQLRECIEQKMEATHGV